MYSKSTLVQKSRLIFRNPISFFAIILILLFFATVALISRDVQQEQPADRPRHALEQDSTPTATEPLPATAPSNVVRIKLASGVVAIDLYPEHAPNTVTALRKLIDDAYFNKDIIIEIEPGVGAAIQQTSVEQTVMSADDINTLESRRGAVAVAKHENSQAILNNIFIAFSRRSDLEPYYTIIGQVVNGLPLVESLAPRIRHRVADIRLIRDDQLVRSITAQEVQQ